MLANLLGAFCAGVLLRRFGRKPLLLCGLAIQIGMLSLIGVSFLIKEHNSDLGQALAVIGLFCYQIFYGCSLGSIVWIYIPEVVSPSMVSVAIACNWTCTSLVVILFPIIEAHLLNDNPAVMFFFFAGWCMFAMALHSKLMVETKNKT